MGMQTAVQVTAGEDHITELAHSLAGRAREAYAAYPDSYAGPTHAFDDCLENLAQDHGLGDVERLMVAEEADRLLGTDWFYQGW